MTVSKLEWYVGGEAVDVAGILPAETAHADRRSAATALAERSACRLARDDGASREQFSHEGLQTSGWIVGLE